MKKPPASAAEDLLNFAAERKFGTILADPPWRFQNRTGKVAPEHKRLSRYGTMTFPEIEALPVAQLAAPVSRFVPLVPDAPSGGLSVMRAWGFQYKGNIVWHKIRKDGGSDGPGRGVLLSQRHRTDFVRCARKQRPHACTGPQPGELRFQSASASIRASPMNSTRLLRRAAGGRISNSLRVATGKNGSLAGTRPTKPITRLGRHTPTTRRTESLRRSLWQPM